MSNSNKVGRPRSADPNETKKTYILKKDHVEKIAAIAYWDRKDLKAVVNDALANYIKEYEENNGGLKLKPKKVW